MNKRQIVFSTLLVLSVLALVGGNVSAQNVQQLVTSTTSTTVTTVTTSVTSLSSTVITGISYTTQTLSGLFPVSVTTVTQTNSFATSTYATITQAYVVVSTSTMQVVSQLVSVSSGSVVTVTNDPTLLFLGLGVALVAVFAAALIVYVLNQPETPRAHYAVPAPQPAQMAQYGGAWYQWEPLTQQWRLVRR